MIVLNFHLPDSFNPEIDDPLIEIAGIVNDTFNLTHDIELVKCCLKESANFSPEIGHFYELYLLRANCGTAKEPEYAFIIDQVIEKIYEEAIGWVSPVVKL